MTIAAGATDTAGLEIGGVLGLAEAAPLARRLLDLRGRGLMLDARGVEHLGAPCAQVLLSAFGTWRSDGNAIRLDGASDGFLESVRLLGLTNAFDEA